MKPAPEFSRGEGEQEDRLSVDEALRIAELEPEFFEIPLDEIFPDGIPYEPGKGKFFSEFVELDDLKLSEQNG